MSTGAALLPLVEIDSEADLERAVIAAHSRGLGNERIASMIRQITQADSIDTADVPDQWRSAVIAGLMGYHGKLSPAAPLQANQPVAADPTEGDMAKVLLAAQTIMDAPEIERMFRAICGGTLATPQIVQTSDIPAERRLAMFMALTGRATLGRHFDKPGVKALDDGVVNRIYEHFNQQDAIGFPVRSLD